jgi:hypothetical protein
MTLPRLAAFNRAWREAPPVHWLMRALLGYRAPPASAARGGMARRGTPAELAALLKTTP